MSEAQPAPPAEDRNEVKWQVALFALMPLILTAVAQPVGRVLDQPARYSLWMRSSPILCAADMLHFLLRYADRYSRDPTLLRRHFRAELVYRFRDGHDGWDPRDIQRTAMVRWTLMLLGGIPCQTVKLVAMQGIPLTKTVALIFFLAIVFGEVLNISAPVVLPSHNGSITMDLLEPSYEQRDTDSSARRSRALVRKIVASLPGFAEGVHIFVVTWVALSLLQNSLVTSGFAHDDKSVWLICPAIASTVIPEIVVIANSFAANRRSSIVDLDFFVIAVAAAAAGVHAMFDDDETVWLTSLVVLLPLRGLMFGVLCFMILLLSWGFWTHIMSSMHRTKVGDMLGILSDVREHSMMVVFLWNIAICTLY